MASILFRGSLRLRGLALSVSLARLLGSVTLMGFMAIACALALLATTVQASETIGPAPTEDRVTLPQDYRKSWVIVRSTYRPEQKRVVNVYANAPAASVVSEKELPYPNGSMFVMESSQVEAVPVRDEHGHFPSGQVVGLHVMRREKGFGEAYGPNRTGEWEYVEYRPDGTFITPPARSATCAACHVKAGATRDWVYHGRFGNEPSAPAKAEMK